MYKIGVLSISPLSIEKTIDFKKLYLMFDKLLIEKVSYETTILSVNRMFEDLKLHVESPLPTLKPVLYSPRIIDFNTQNINYLKQKEFIEFWDFEKYVDEYLTSPDGISVIGTIPGDNPSLFNSHFADLTSREISAWRMTNLQEEIYPILIFPPKKSESVRKQDVLNFVLKAIPEPDDNISWEQLSDFKSDPDTMRKYYALTKWVNDVSKKNISLNEIEDEFNYLYHEYANQYRIHKMKYKQGIIEIIATAAIDVLTGNLGAGYISTSLFTVWKQNLNLLEAETKFTGKEVAYIYKTNQTLK